MPNLTWKSRIAKKKAVQTELDCRRNRRVALAAGALVALATAACYLNSFNGPFVFDDVESIVHNPTIHDIGSAVFPPAAGGATIVGRPILNLSLAVNYVCGGMDVWGYHVFNLAVHVLAVLTLFGIVRRTLMLPSVGERLALAAPYLAAAVALLWAVHPLQTELVTYVVQRAESLMGLFYFLTLYCVIRSSASGAARWSLAAVLSCAMGMATKEVMVTVPLIALLYDRTFLAGSFARALQKRWGLYAGMAACWGVLVALMLAAGNRGETAGFCAKAAADWWSYTQAECCAILTYLRLALWPDALCLDYGTSVSRSLWQIVPGALIAGSIALLSVWGLRRGRTWGFLGAFFLVILAPTSSIVPLRDPVFEHRMYLPLAAVAAAGVLGAFGLWNALAQRWKFADLPPLRRWALPAIVLVAAVAALGIRTILRNCDYSSTVAIWQDTVAKAPANPRAHYTFGTILMTDANDVPRAMEQFCDAIGLAPDYADAHANLGVALFGQGNTDQAVPELREAIRLNPNLADAHNDLGLVLAREKKPDQAAEEFRETLRPEPQPCRYAYQSGRCAGHSG